PTSASRAERQRRLRIGTDRVLTEQQREHLAAGPRFRRIVVVRARAPRRLSRRVQYAGPIPRAEVNRPAHLTVVGGRGRGPTLNRSAAGVTPSRCANTASAAARSAGASRRRPGAGTS